MLITLAQDDKSFPPTIKPDEPKPFFVECEALRDLTSTLTISPYSFSGPIAEPFMDRGHLCARVVARLGRGCLPPCPFARRNRPWMVENRTCGLHIKHLCASVHRCA